MVKQLNLFDRKSFNITRELKECMAQVVADSGRSRAEFLDLMNRLADRFGVRLVKGNGNHLRMATFEKWLNPNDHEHIPSPSALAIFSEIGASSLPLQVLAAPIGCRVIDEKDIKLLLWAKEYHRIRESRAKMRKLEADL
ncbi:hypothetical protein [Desulfofustis glycolicus]|uniref:Uncharacterized protein n=1 Tax=Desulfofustis glycolicus DSM 9705 TaxID=1121409 RepID=A0A1M5S695_9BACT|nr:hypothetical protein [Desulfofustis glycolicus]SHH34152.1 hypothetical protein SAMN02745124_00189 [Desulfofustis glycolicus DSM 9705]